MPLSLTQTKLPLSVVKITEHQIEADGLRWAYRETVPESPSSRPPVILLHGLVSQSHSWRDVLKPLADNGYRAIAPDWIGHGDSAKPDKRHFDYRPQTLADAFGSFLSTLEIDRYILVVQGFISTAGLLHAAQHPEQIEKLVILNMPLTPDAKLPFKIAQMGWPLIGEILTQDPILVDRTLEGGGPYTVSDEDLDVYRRPFLKSSDAGRALLATVRQLNLESTLTEINQKFAGWQTPTCIVWGTDDKWLPLSQAETFAQQLENVDIKTLDKTGHYAQEDWAEKVRDAIVPFLLHNHT